MYYRRLIVIMITMLSINLFKGLKFSHLLGSGVFIKLNSERQDRYTLRQNPLDYKPLTRAAMFL